MKMKLNLYKQLLTIIVIIIIMFCITLILILPNKLLPIYENNMYQSLRQSLIVSRNDISNTKDTNVAYLYVYTNNIYYSVNINDIINLEPTKIISKIKENKTNYGKFNNNKKTYYYYIYEDLNYYKIALASNDYILKIRTDVLKVLIPILLIISFVIIALIYFWNKIIINKIEHLKEKIDNLDNKDYKDNYLFKLDDEFIILSNAIDDMKMTLAEQEEYKNQMYQNISHDFKTPIAVIKSYIEGIEDNVIDPNESIDVIKEETLNLERKVNSLLYLNKLNYLQEKKVSLSKIDLQEVIPEVIKKFKVQRPEIEWEITYADKFTKFNGNFDIWETIFDNLLNNFMRYANKKIKITIKNKRISLYNDGENIDENIVNNIFNPYIKGINGCTGLGLSIVKKSLSFIKYDINVKNEKNGITFIIK